MSYNCNNELLNDVHDAIQDYDLSEYRGDREGFGVTIRCYLLSWAIDNTLNYLRGGGGAPASSLMITGQQDERLTPHSTGQQESEKGENIFCNLFRRQAIVPHNIFRMESIQKFFTNAVIQYLHIGVSVIMR